VDKNSEIKLFEENMIKETLTFHFGIPKKLKNGITDNTSEYFSKKFYKDLGLKCFSGCWSEIELDSPKFSEFYEAVLYHRKKSKADFIGLCSLTQEIIESEKKPIEWYELNPDNSIFDFITPTKINKIDIEKIKADKIPQDIHLGTGGFYNIHCDEIFKQFCIDNNFSGVDFIWMIDQSKFEANQWFVPVIEKPIGRGIDHPWFNHKTLKGSDSWQPINPMWRTGVFHFSTNQFKKNISFNENQKKIYSLFKKSKNTLTVISNRRVLRNELPNTDFAYNWKSEDFIRDNIARKQRGICINRKTRNLLLENGFVTIDEVSPIEVIDIFTSNNGTNSSFEYPSSIYSQEEISLIKNDINTLYETHLSKKLPQKEITLKDALSILKKQKSKRQEDFNSGIRINNAKQDFKFIPEDYLKILSISNGCSLNPECELLLLNEIISKTKEKNDYLMQINGFISKDTYVIAESINGDWYSINAIRANENYGEITRISHETCTKEYNWKNTAEFIFDMLTGFYE
jgi:hypothetical protein